MACLKGTGQILGQQVYRWMQKGLIWAIPTDIPHLIVVDVGEAKGVDHGVSRLLCSPETAFLEKVGAEQQKSKAFLMVCVGY